MVNVELKQKIISKNKDEKEDEVFYITSALCIDEGDADYQLWERYRPPQQVLIQIFLDFNVFRKNSILQLHIPNIFL